MARKTGDSARRAREDVVARNALYLLGFIILTLASLLVVPVAFQRRSSALHEEISDLGAPARGLADAVRLSLAHQIASLIAFEVTEREEFRDIYQRSAVNIGQALTALESPARSLGPDVSRPLIELRRLAAEWHARVAEDGLLDREVPAAVRLQRLVAARPLFTATSVAAGALGNAASRAMFQRREAIRVAHRLEAALTVGLVLLTLAAAVAATWLAFRLRGAAAELRNRAEDEAALLEVARTIGGAATVGEVLQRVVDGAVAAAGAAGAYVERTGAPGLAGEVEVVAVAGRVIPPLGIRAPFAGSLSEAAFEHGEPEPIAGVGAIAGSIGTELIRSCGRCTGLVVPLPGDDAPLGALVLLRAESEPRFTAREVALARGFGDLASSALRRALLTEAVERERRARTALLHSTGEGIFGVDLDGRCTFLNRAGAEMLGYSPDEALGSDMHRLTHHTRADGTPFPADECPISRVMREGVAVRVEDDVIWRKDGTSLRTEYSSNPILEDGRIAGAVVAFKDITERKWAEESRRRLLEREREARGEAERRAREEEALRRATGALSASFTEDEVIHRIARSAVQATNADGAIVERIDVVRNELEVVSAAGDRVPPVGTRLAYARSYAERTIERAEPEIIARVASAEGRLSDALIRRCPDCSALVVPLVNAGEPIGDLILVRGPDKLRFRPDEVGRAHTFGNLAALAFRRIHVLQESERRRMELERVMESRARLMRGFSHDVKNPLGAADGLLEVLESGVPEPLTDGQKESVARTRRSIRGALELIDNLLRLAHAEAARIEIEWAAVDARDAVREIAEEYRAQAEAKGIDTVIDLPRELPLIVSDASRIRQVLGNLLSNAVKYTERGHITVRIRKQRQNGAPGPGEWISIAVSDTGPGIPEAQRGMLFEEFRRLEPGAKRGAGVGLASSRRVAHALGGEISVESEVGVGSTFTLWLPLAHPGMGRAREAAD